MKWSRPAMLRVTRPALSSTYKWRETAGSEMSKPAARSVTRTGRWRTRANISRLTGWATAASA